MKPKERKHPGEQREKSEYDQKALDVRRTARVVAGGRRFSFRATVVIGNRMGKVGVGMGKGPDVASAMDKAVAQARKHIIIIPLSTTKSISHEVSAKYKAARVMLKPAREGRGLIAGGPVRIIVDMAGVKNLTAKIVGRTVNKVNNARATLKALSMLSL